MKSSEILALVPDNIKAVYPFIPYGNWDKSEKGCRPAPYSQSQTYPETHPMWLSAETDRMGVRLDDLILLDYDGNKPGAAGEIPTVAELATALGFQDSQHMFDTSLVQWNQDMDSLHFLFRKPDHIDFSQLKQSNQGDNEFFWKYIDVKTGNQLMYLKKGKTNRLLHPDMLLEAHQTLVDRLKPKSVDQPTSEDFNYAHKASDVQIEKAQEWLNHTCIELESMEEDSGRNNTLNMHACTAAGLVAGSALDNQSTYERLFHAALKAGLDHSETLNTLESAWTEGFRTPRRDAPFSGHTQSASEAFAGHVVIDTNIDVNAEQELSTLLNDGEFDPTDPNIGILYQQYKYLKENWCMNAEGRFIDTRNLASYGKTAFDAMHNAMMPVRPGSKAQKRFKASEVFEASNPIVIVDLFYMPGGEKFIQYEKKDYLNSYMPYEPERPAEADVMRVRGLINAHLHWLFEDATIRQFMFDWLAWQVQHTGQLVGWLPLLLGCRGDGKSILFELVTVAVGSQNTKMMSNDSIISSFQDWATGSAVTAFEEIKIETRDSRNVANKLKPFITERRVMVNPKGTKEVTIPNFANYIAFSNEPDPIAIAQGDRRWFVSQTNHFGSNTVIERTQTDMKQHFDDIKNLVNRDENHAAVHWALKEHNINPSFEDHRFRAPQTIFSNELVEQTVSEKEARLVEYLEYAQFPAGGGRLIDHPDGFQIQDFRPMMPDNWFPGLDKKPSSIMLGKMLRNIGYELKSRQATDGSFIKTFKKM
ncbi:DNA primase [Vibrio phage D63]